mmetsp:Transcript_116062/g.324588  ORF Transcript_116062/g.324588 Transcript_116062/m.324588 type:complete len:228 (+) Transcript_116062:331-1014(+)
MQQRDVLGVGHEQRRGCSGTCVPHGRSQAHWWGGERNKWQHLERQRRRRPQRCEHLGGRGCRAGPREVALALAGRRRGGLRGARRRPSRIRRNHGARLGRRHHGQSAAARGDGHRSLRGHGCRPAVAERPQGPGLGIARGLVTDVAGRQRAEGGHREFADGRERVPERVAERSGAAAGPATGAVAPLVADGPSAAAADAVRTAGVGGGGRRRTEAGPRVLRQVRRQP